MISYTVDLGVHNIDEVAKREGEYGSVYMTNRDWMRLTYQKTDLETPGEWSCKDLFSNLENMRVTDKIDPVEESIQNCFVVNEQSIEEIRIFDSVGQ